MSEQPELIIHPSEFPTFLKARMMDSSVEEFANQLGVTRELVYMLMSGKRTPSAAILEKLGLEVYYGKPKGSGKGKRTV